MYNAKSFVNMIKFRYNFQSLSVIDHINNRILLMINFMDVRSMFVINFCNICNSDRKQSKC